MKKFAQYISEEEEFYRKQNARKNSERFLHAKFYEKGIDSSAEKAYDAWRKDHTNPEALKYFHNLVPKEENLSSEEHAENVRNALLGVLGSPRKFFKTEH